MSICGIGYQTSHELHPAVSVLNAAANFCLSRAAIADSISETGLARLVTFALARPGYRMPARLECSSVFGRALTGPTANYFVPRRTTVLSAETASHE